MQKIKSVLVEFVQHRLPNILKSYQSYEYDSILDERDNEVFSNHWMYIYTIVKKELQERNYNDSFSYELRELVFNIVITETSNSDLAAYISDDFGLIQDAAFAEVNNGWLNALWSSYNENKIPHGQLVLVDGKLCDIVK